MEKSESPVRSLSKEDPGYAEFENVHVEQNEALADFKKRERKVVAKLDLYIAPLLGLFNFIVRYCTFPLVASSLTGNSHTLIDPISVSQQRRA